MARRRAGRNDTVRWANIDNYDVAWNTRTFALAEWIPAGSRVLEFGAGRQALKDRLPVNCTYIPSDLVKRNEQTLVYDLNQRPLQPLPDCNVAILSGVFEYVDDLDAVVAHLSKSVDRIITSYASTEIAQNARVIDRRSAGWINDYSTDRFQAFFHKHGFATTAAKTWGNQVLFCFESTRVNSAAAS